MNTGLNICRTDAKHPNHSTEYVSNAPILRVAAIAGSRHSDAEKSATYEDTKTIGKKDMYPHCLRLNNVSIRRARNYDPNSPNIP